MNNNIYQLKNKNGLCIDFIAQGGKIKSVKMPVGDGFVDVALGYDTVEEVIEGDAYIGALCGRVANRINKAQFNLENTLYTLEQNDRGNHLHGGSNGFHAKFWDVNVIQKEGYVSAYELSIVSEDGDGNYPGKLKVNVIYALNNNNEFLINIEAKSDKTTVVNITSHPYFNLNGVGCGKIFNHFLEINAEQFTPIDEFCIPTGEIVSVIETDMDFSKSKRIGDIINSDFDPIHQLKGLDHNFVINNSNEKLAFACRLLEPESGRAVELYTTQPGVQVYTAMHFDGSEIGKDKIPMLQYCGVALEAQNFPDAPNKLNFPSCVLKANETYSEQILYKFIF